MSVLGGFLKVLFSNFFFFQNAASIGDGMSKKLEKVEGAGREGGGAEERGGAADGGSPHLDKKKLRVSKENLDPSKNGAKPILFVHVY